jgi:biopolymer transport protein ExbB
MILQVFYNYILSRIEALTIDMENSTINMVDVLSKYEEKK